MMHGSIEGPRRSPSGPLRYKVEPRDDGWSVVVNGCATRPMSRREARRLARSLQAEADGLRHQERRGLSRWLKPVSLSASSE
jgi:hypothetical protein